MEKELKPEELAVARISRKRTIPVLKPKALEQLRVMTWFAYLLDGANLDDGSGEAFQLWLTGDDHSDIPFPAKELNKWVNKNGDALSDKHKDLLTDLQRQRYQDGFTSPNDVTLEVFEELITGSREIYEVGSPDYPLWAILSGDTQACESYLAEVLPPMDGDVYIDARQRVKTLYEVFIAPQWCPDSSLIPDWKNSQGEMHPVRKSFLTMQYRFAVKESDSHLLQTATVDEEIVAVIALWQLALQRSDYPILQIEWLLMGICYGFMANKLSADIQSYVVGQMNKNAKLVDTRFAKVKIPTFEQRWTQTINHVGAFYPKE